MNAQFFSSSVDLSEEFVTNAICDWWWNLHNEGDPGAASWEELDRLEQEVTACMANRPRDIRKAESLTAYAMLLVAGCSDL